MRTLLGKSKLSGFAADRACLPARGLTGTRARNGGAAAVAGRVSRRSRPETGQLAQAFPTGNRMFDAESTKAGRARQSDGSVENQECDKKERYSHRKACQPSRHIPESSVGFPMMTQDETTGMDGPLYEPSQP